MPLVNGRWVNAPIPVNNDTKEFITAQSIVDARLASGNNTTSMVGPYSAEAYAIADRTTNAINNKAAQENVLGATSPTPSYSGGSSSYSAPKAAVAAPAPVLNSAAINNTNKAIKSLDTEKSIGYDNIDDSYDSLIKKYDREATRTKGEYDESSDLNTNNLQRNKQNSLVSAAQGLRGLRGVLGSIGALNGDGRNLANRAVTSEVNADIGGAVETSAINAQGLDKAYDKFEEEDEDRRNEASTSRTNQRTALEGSIAGKRQTFLQKLAEIYNDAEQTSNSKKYLDQAGDLNDTIAKKSRVQAAPLSAKGAEYNPADLESYLAGAGDKTVEIRGGNLGGGVSSNGIFTPQNAQEDEESRRRLAVV